MISRNKILDKRRTSEMKICIKASNELAKGGRLDLKNFKAVGHTIPFQKPRMNQTKLQILFNGRRSQNCNKDSASTDDLDFRLTL